MLDRDTSSGAAQAHSGRGISRCRLLGHKKGEGVCVSPTAVFAGAYSVLYIDRWIDTHECVPSANEIDYHVHIVRGALRP